METIATQTHPAFNELMAQRAVTDLNIQTEIASIESRLRQLRGDDEPTRSEIEAAFPVETVSTVKRGPGRPRKITTEARYATVSLPSSTQVGNDVASALSGTPTKQFARPRKVTPAMLQSRQTQGIYLGLMRHTPKSKRAAFKEIMRTQGREAAIAAMRQARG